MYYKSTTYTETSMDEDYFFVFVVGNLEALDPEIVFLENSILLGHVDKSVNDLLQNFTSLGKYSIFQSWNYIMRVQF